MKQYLDILDGLVDLMAPLVEVVIHDLESNEIAYIKGALSDRCIGDPSNLDMPTLRQELAEMQQSYPKKNLMDDC